jgi:serine/threonine protein kinase
MMANAHGAENEAELSVEHAARYRSLLQLGHGGMARVYLAVRIGAAGFRRLCVLKRMQDHLLQNEEFLRMFLREARLAARLNHPNVVSTEEVGQDADGHFMAMEYLEGQSYLALLNKVKRDKLDFALSLQVLIEVLRGLEYAHAMTDFDGTPMQIVHRDLSPGNIFITYDGRIKVLDFGIAKVLDSRGETQTGVLKGKLTYMAPEQVKGHPVSIQTDLYAVGVLLWEAASGRRRWENLPDAAVLRYLISGKPPESPGAEARGLPESVNALCLKALAVDSSERFGTARAFRGALERLLDEMGRTVGGELVGQAVAHHFREERETLRVEIETLLKRIQIEESISISWRSQVQTTKQLAELEIVSSSQRTPSDAWGRHTNARTGASGARRAPSPKPRLLLAGLGVVAVASAAMIARGLLAPSPMTPAVAVAVAPVKAPARAVSDTPLVKGFQISAKPASAVIYADGKRLPSNSEEVEIPASGRLEIRVEAPGYMTESRTVDARPGTSVAFALLPIQASDASPALTAAVARPEVVSRNSRGTRAIPQRVGVTAPVSKAAEPAAPAPAAASERPEPPPEAVRHVRPAGVALDSEDPWK